jgi:SHS family lactate transporter-like MFS transporter
MLSDMFGRKWPLAINLWILAVLQVGTAFAPTYEAFIGVRALFGVAMGGIWGLSAAMSLENMPVEARGLFSGVLQQGYSIGYLIAAVINLTLVPATAEGYKGIFHFGAGFTALIAAVVMLIPESHIYASKEGEEKIRFGKRIGNFVKDLKLASRQYWRMFLYCVVLSMFFNWMR